MVHYQLPSDYLMPDGLAGAPGALIFFRPLSFHQNQTGADKVRVVRHQLLSSYSVPGRLAGAPGALIFFRPLFFHPNRTRADRALMVHYQSPSSYSVPRRLAGAPGALIFFCLLFFHQGKKRRFEGQQAFAPFRGTYGRAYSIRPYPTGRRRMRRPSDLPTLAHWGKTCAPYPHIPIKKINRCPSAFPHPIHFLILVLYPLCILSPSTM